MGFVARVRSEMAYLRGSLRALRKTMPIAKHRTRTLRDLVEDLARRYESRTALISERETFTYAQWNGRANRWARFARAQGVAKGDVVALLMPNRSEYMAVWVGIAKVGGVTALLNTNLTGASLAHCIKAVGARHLVVDASMVDLFETARPFLADLPVVFSHGESKAWPDVVPLLQGFSEANIPADERVALTVDDRCIYVFTSGTTGLPKAANINHYRVQLAMIGFAAITNSTKADRVYDCLPMYHTNGGVVAPGSVLAVGGCVIIKTRFSAREFWSDIARHECTTFIYIGELLRYLLNAPGSPTDGRHGLRLCFGNGLRPDIWETFRDRFRMPNILEFYAATEGNVTIFNFDSRPGAVGRIPKWAESRFVVKIVRFDVAAEAPARDARGFCIACAPDEVGEAIGEILNDPRKPAARFEGYADKAATEGKVLRDVFVPGDAWFRTGDLMRKDAEGYFYFVDRVGDTFRWKGENVATSEVSEAITAFPGVREANVYGVAVPGQDGRAGMVALVVDDPERFDLVGFRAFLATRLPDYARPLFVRFPHHLDVTGTFKQRKVDLVAEGFDPARVADALYVALPGDPGYRRVDADLFASIARGEHRL